MTSYSISSVDICQSRLYTGFPSDHYLLITEVKAHLAQRTPKAPRAPKLQYGSDPAQVKEFNDILADLWGEPPPDDRNAILSLGKRSQSIQIVQAAPVNVAKILQRDGGSAIKTTTHG